MLKELYTFLNELERELSCVEAVLRITDHETLTIRVSCFYKGDWHYYQRVITEQHMKDKNFLQFLKNDTVMAINLLKEAYE